MVTAQKTYVADCISKTVKKNTGELPQYYIMDNHPAIVPREIFNRVQEEFARRNSKTALSTTSSKTNKGRFSSKYALSELIRCSECGAAYRRVTWPAKEQGGQKRIVWRCVSRLEHGKETCKTAPTIPESALHAAIMEAIQLLKLDTEDAKPDVSEVLAEIIQRPNGETVQNIDALIEQQRDELIKLLTQNPDANEPENMDNAKFTMMLNSMEVLQSRKETLLRRTQADENAEHRMSEIMDTLQSGELDISEYDDTLVRKLVESVTVISDKLTEVRITWK